MSILQLVPKDRETDNMRRNAAMNELRDRSMYRKTVDEIVRCERQEDRRLLLDLFATWIADEMWRAK